jgi:hypothetical protein
MRRALAIIRQRPADVLVALLAFAAWFALCIAATVAFPDAIPQPYAGAAP